MLISHQAGVGEPKLKQLKLWYTDLSSVSTEVLVRAIQNLEKVEFSFGRMRAEQITGILTMLKGNQQGMLKDLLIFLPLPSVRGSVSQTLLEEAMQNNAVLIV